MKNIKNYDFGGDENARKIIVKDIKSRVLDDIEVFNRLKSLIHLRDRDRSTRENSIRVLKKFIKLTKKSTNILLEYKFDVLICFILEREYLHP